MNIIVTGASRGIGYEIVKLMCLNSDHHIVAISRNESNLKKLKDECIQLNPKSSIITISQDLNDFGNELISKILKGIDSIDVIINNAGAIINKPFAELTKEDLNYVYNVNLFSVVKLIQSLMDYMGKTKTGHIVNIGSMGGFQGSSKFPGLAAYSSSKAALANLTECLSIEFKDENIAVNCLALGATQTEMLSNAFPGYKAPLTAKEMAEFIVYFSLNGHHFFNGKILPVAMSNP